MTVARATTGSTTPTASSPKASCCHWQARIQRPWAAALRATLSHLKQRGANHLTFVCLVAAPEGVRRLEEYHPDVPVVTAALDRELDDKAYIRPGRGDAGDRIFGTQA